ncbi:Armadillo-type fold [Phytophthora cactorum]|nr:Armadillo-type fold [Phytophthora cactorum]
MDKALLTRATSKDDTPTPGYLYGEIARMTQHSYDTCTKVQDFLISRVKNKHHTIKYKALQVIKHVCREGRVDFKREMQKHIPTIKECLQFRGVPDPLKGDEYYRRVREAAKEVLDAIYDTDNAPGLGGMGMSARIQGVGANPNDNGGGGSGWSSKIWGGKNSNDSSLPPPPMAGPPMGGYNGAAPPGAPVVMVGHNLTAASAYGQQQPDYSQQGSYGGPSGANQPYGGAPPNQYGGAPPPFNDQKFSGIGNPMYQDPRADEKGFFKGLKEKVASKYNKSDKPTFGGGPPGSSNPPEGWSFATNRGPTSGNYGPSPAPYNPEEPYRPTGFTGGGYRPGGYGQDPRESASSQLREKSYDGDRKKGRVGGAWSDADVPSAGTSAGMPQNSGHENRTQSFNGSTRDSRSYSRNSDYEYEDNKRREASSQGSRPFPQPPVLTGQTSGAQSDGSYERNLDKMDAFLKSAITLDAEIVGPILEDCLSDDQWTVVSKALATIDALLKTDGCEEFEEYFSENSSEIEACAKSDKAAVRDRAVKVLNHLGIAAGLGASTSSHDSSKKSKPSSHHRKHPAAEADLLGGFDDTPSAGDNDSLFSGLQTNAPPQQSAQEMPQPTASANDVTDMFGGLQLQSSTASTASNPEPSQPAAPVVPAAPAAPAPAPSANQTMVLDPLLEPVPAAPAMNQGFGGPMNMNMNMMNFSTPQQMAQMQQMQQMQYMQQMQQMQYMQQMQQMQQMQGMGGNPGSQVIGAAMTPTGYIAKTIQEPTDGLASDSGFGFMKKKDDSFNFVKDAMKNS